MRYEQTSEPPPPRVVTISATFGAGGSVIAPRLADRLRLPFFDRLVHPGAGPTAESISEQLTKEEANQVPKGRLASRLARLTSALNLPLPAPDDIDPIQVLRRQVVASVHAIVTGDGGVILGRAAAVVAASDPGVFHVRLTGPVERRIRQAMVLANIPFDRAKQHQVDTDRAWARFVTTLFDRDPSDPSLYHMVIDSTSIPFEDCVNLIAVAATSFWERVERDRIRESEA
jgi:Cytidylate kinase-like family